MYLKIYFYCVCVFCLHVCTYMHCMCSVPTEVRLELVLLYLELQIVVGYRVQSPQRPEEGFESLITGVTDGC